MMRWQTQAVAAAKSWQEKPGHYIEKINNIDFSADFMDFFLNAQVFLPGWCCCCFCCCFMLSVAVTLCYNIETRYPIMLQIPSQSSSWSHVDNQLVSAN
jgi:hypothetical protein